MELFSNSTKTYLTKDGKFVIQKGTNGNKFILSERTYIEYRPGGSATGVASSFVSDEEATAVKNLFTEDYSESRLAEAKVARISGTKAGTVKLYIPEDLTVHSSQIDLYLVDLEGTKTELYKAIVPDDGVLTVIMNNFGYVIAIPDDYLVTIDNKVLFDVNDNYLAPKEEDAIN